MSHDRQPRPVLVPIAFGAAALFGIFMADRAHVAGHDPAAIMFLIGAALFGRLTVKS